jgi:hypothetical protein
VPGVSHLVVVDAYNAAWRLFGDLGGDLDAARRRLVERVRGASPGKLVPGGVGRVHLVFDTLPGAFRAGLQGREGKVSWHYATGSADELILDRLRDRAGREGMPHVVLITNDRELAGRARQLGARIVGIDEFFGPDTGPPPGRPIAYEGPPFTPADFDLPDGEIDLTDADAEPDRR